MALTSDQITAQNFADFYQTILPYLNGGGFKMTKLWENPDPTQTFSAQNVTLSSSDYDMLLVVVLFSNTYAKQYSNIFQKGEDALISICGGGSSGVVCRNRELTRVSDTKYHAENGYAVTGAKAQTQNDGSAIPVAIYGIKLQAYDNISCVMMSSTWETGETTVEFTDPIIDGDSIFDVYLPSQYADLIYSSLSVSGHTLTITFPSAQASDIEVKLRVNRG